MNEEYDLIVAGGGSAGLTAAGFATQLGARVALVDQRPHRRRLYLDRLHAQQGVAQDGQDRLLPRDEPDASHFLARVFESEGIDLRLGAPVQRVWQEGTGDRGNTGGIHLIAGGKELAGDTLLVDDNLRTSQHHIYASGDCTGGQQFTHYAGWQGLIAARNVLLPGTSKGIADQVPWTTFTDPEVAHAGLTKEKVQKKTGNLAAVQPDRATRLPRVPRQRLDRTGKKAGSRASEGEL